MEFWLFVAFCLLLLFLWCQASYTATYWVKMFAFYTWMVLSAMIMIPIAALSPRDPNNNRYVHWLWGKVTPVFGLKLDVRNIENFHGKRPFVIVCNHQSALDYIAMYDIWPERTTMWVKKELMYYSGPMALFGWLSGYIFVDRSSNDPAITRRTIQNTADIMLKRDTNMWIYPEGTRNSRTQFLPFKKGAFALAIQAKVPIVPVVFSSYQDFLCSKRKIFNPGKVIVTCLAPVSTEGLTADDVVSLADRVRDLMTPVFAETSKQVHDEAILAGQSLLLTKCQF